MVDTHLVQFLDAAVSLCHCSRWRGGIANAFLHCRKFILTEDGEMATMGPYLAHVVDLILAGHSKIYVKLYCTKVPGWVMRGSRYEGELGWRLFPIRLNGRYLTLGLM